MELVDVIGIVALVAVASLVPAAITAFVDVARTAPDRFPVNLTKGQTLLLIVLSGGVGGYWWWLRQRRRLRPPPAPARG